ncbi:phenylacetic acid degradation protein PaaY [Rhodococcus opacus PD630]|nr:phenylacetic acid degradation protein PaaY [Rhodococcus opacus PD630]
MWIAPNATIVGTVQIGSGVGIWYGAVARGDAERIEIGERTNIQDGCVLHADPGFPLVIGRGVSVGHNVILHGCTIGDDILVGMGATVMNGARVGAGTLIAANALIPEGMEIPPGTLVAGMPGKVRRALTTQELAAVRTNADTYAQARLRHAAATETGSLTSAWHQAEPRI